MIKLALAAAVAVSPFVLWFWIIRPRLGRDFTETQLQVKGFWPRLRARLYAFRSFVAGAVGAWAVAIPPIIEGFAGMDLSFLPQPWPAYVTAATTIYLTVNRALATTPGDKPT